MGGVERGRRFPSEIEESAMRCQVLGARRVKRAGILGASQRARRAETGGWGLECPGGARGVAVYPPRVSMHVRSNSERQEGE